MRRLKFPTVGCLGMSTLLALGGLGGCGGSSKSANEPTAMGGSDDPSSFPIAKVDKTRCNPEGKRVVESDINGDGRPDVWKLYKKTDEGGTTVEVLTCRQTDFNRDGKKDQIVLYDDKGNILIEEFDFTFQGNVDERRHYDPKTGKIYLIERDTDHDRKPDTWDKFDSAGKLEATQRDRNGDGKPDLWEQWENGVVMAILYDDDYDNRVDRKEARKVKKRQAGSAEGAALKPPDEDNQQSAPPAAPPAAPTEAAPE